MNALSSKSTPFLDSLAQQHADTATDWVETGRRKNQPEGAKANEKSPKIQQLKDGRTKGDQPRKAKGKSRAEGMQTNLVLIPRPPANHTTDNADDDTDEFEQAEELQQVEELEETGARRAEVPKGHVLTLLLTSRVWPCGRGIRRQLRPGEGRKQR